MEAGPIFGILSMLFFSATTSGQNHPNVEDRLTNALEKMQVADNEYGWAIACVGLELWANQFDIYVDWTDKNKVSFKELYYKVIAQLKEQNL